MSITIKDVAEDADVSTATVSHVINKTRNVSEAVALRVQASMAKLNYYPNQIVGSIRRKRTYTVGLVIPSIANETFGMLADHIQRILFKSGLSLIVFNSYHDCAMEEDALNAMLMKRVDAVFAIPASRTATKLQEVINANIPVILLDRELTNCEVDVVKTDNFAGEYMAINYLIRMGHRRIGYVDRMVELSHSIEQRNGYIKALEDNGISYDPSYVVGAQGHYFKAGISAVQTLMLRHPDITAIACYYDLMAFGVIRGLLDIGYKVPQDVSVIGFDNMIFTEATWPSMTTVEVPLKQMAEEACELLLRRIKEKDEDETQERTPKKIALAAKLMIRESVRRIDE